MCVPVSLSVIIFNHFDELQIQLNNWFVVKTRYFSVWFLKSLFLLYPVIKEMLEAILNFSLYVIYRLFLLLLSFMSEMPDTLKELQRKIPGREKNILKENLLSQDVAVQMLQDNKLAIRRCELVSNMIWIYKIYLLDYFLLWRSMIYVTLCSVQSRTWT